MLVWIGRDLPIVQLRTLSSAQLFFLLSNSDKRLLVAAVVVVRLKVRLAASSLVDRYIAVAAVAFGCLH